MSESLERPDWRPTVRRLGRVVFGDRTGVVLWLGLVAVLGLTWRIGFFITDNYAIANALVNVADGRLAITENVYSLTLGSQPGLHESGGRLYGRNYGQVVMALPVVWSLESATLVAPLHLVLVAGWSLVLLLFFQQLATVLDRSTLRGVGIVVAFVTFAANVLDPTPLDSHVLHLAALQLSTLFAAAFAGVLFYRFVDVFHHRRVAVAAGVAAVLALPVGFWASIPKRHVLVTTLLIGSLYCFARSRRAAGREGAAEREEYVALAGAYVFVSLVAWIHAFEGFFALVALGSVDLLTGGVRDRKRLAAICLAIGVGLAPMFLTNALISGNPLEPPRLLPSHGSGGLELGPGGEIRAPDAGETGSGGGSTSGASTGGSDPMGGGGGSTGGSDGGSSGASGRDGGGGGDPLSFLAPLLGPLQGPIGQASFILGFVLRTVTEGIDVLGDPERLWRIFGRSGWVPTVNHAATDYETIELTVLEAAPLLGGFLALPAVVFRAATTGRTEQTPVPWDLSPSRQTDLLVGVLGVVLTVIYLSRLPLHTMITVRYILYTTPFWLYGVVRLPPVREAVAGASRRTGLAYGATALGGAAVCALLLSALDVAIGEAMQFHALVNLGAAALVAALVAGRALAPERVRVEWVATGLGIAAGATTAFLLLAGLEYFSYGPYALGVARQLSQSIPVF